MLPGEGLPHSGSLGLLGTGMWIEPAPLISLGSHFSAFIRCCNLAFGMFPSANNFYGFQQLKSSCFDLESLTDLTAKPPFCRILWADTGSVLQFHRLWLESGYQIKHRILKYINTDNTQIKTQSQKPLNFRESPGDPVVRT